MPATVWGSTIKTTPENAAFANGVMTRLLDISDTYLGKSRGHPSDMNAGIIAVAESIHADGKSLINAITLAYDVYCSFCDAIDVNAKGWDQPVYGVLGCVLGVGKLLKLNHDQMANAVSLALAPNMALAQARRGHLSNWKGCAGANASRNAVFAAGNAAIIQLPPRLDAAVGLAMLEVNAANVDQQAVVGSLPRAGLELQTSQDVFVVRHPEWSLTLDRRTGRTQLVGRNGETLFSALGPHTGRKLTINDLGKRREGVATHWAGELLDEVSGLRTSAEKVAEGIALKVGGRFPRPGFPDQAVEGECELQARPSGAIKVSYRYLPEIGRAHV